MDALFLYGVNCTKDIWDPLIPLLPAIDIPVHLLLGDRGQADAVSRTGELRLAPSALERLQIQLVPDSCHMPMIENPRGLAELLIQICSLGGRMIE